MNVEICRACSESKGTTPIFNRNHELQISAKIMYCCSKLSITEGDGLPALICAACEAEVAAAYRFVLKCEAADQKLRAQANAAASQGVLATPDYYDDCKPKLEIKLEDNCMSDDDNYENIPNCTQQLRTRQDVKEECSAANKIKHKETYKKRTRYNALGPFKCSECGKESSCQSALIAHMRYHTDEKPFPCSNCEKKYRDQGSLKRHVERNHYTGVRERNFICENCGKGFFSKHDVKIHMRVHTGETPYACSECPKQFTQASALLRHKKHHSGEKPHICTTCTKRFGTKEQLRKHMSVHTDDKNYSCSICNLRLKYRNNLNKHMLLHSAPKSFVCNYCGQTFNQKGNLKTHIDRKHSNKSGYCNDCCKDVSNIEAHMWMHTGQRPLKCEQCSSSFYKLNSLVRHINYRHKNPDKFKCMFEGCAMTFPSRPMLDFHTAKLHETGFPFPCDRCSRGFYRKNDLARHKIGTHKEKL